MEVVASVNRVKNEGEVNKMQTDPENPSENALKFSIKKYVCGSGGGMTTAPVFVFADSRMGADDFVVYPCAGLGTGQELDSVGYIVFCKTRACNVAFYTWWMKYIYIPWIKQLRTFSNLAPLDPFYHTEDGEWCQIQMLLKGPGSDAMIDLLKEEKIAIIKLSASTTEIEQPMDNSNEFKSGKTVLKNIDEDELNFVGAVKDNITNIMYNHNHTSDWSGTAPNKTLMKPWFVKTASKALQRVWYASARTADLKHIAKGFVHCGFFHKKCKVKPYYIGFDRILNNVRRRPGEKPLTIEASNLIKEKLPHLASCIRRAGELDDCKMMDCLGWKENDPYWEASVNHLVIYRRRCIILTNLSWLEEEDKKKVAAAEAVEAAKAQKAQKTLDRDAKKVASAADKADKDARRELAKNTAKEKKDVEADLRAKIKQLEAQLKEKPPNARPRAEETAPAAEKDAPPQKKRKRVVKPDDGVAAATERAALAMTDFTAFVDDSRSKRPRHVGTYCSSTECYKNPAAVVVEEGCMKPCLQNSLHKHLCHPCWMAKRVCKLCTTSE